MHNVGALRPLQCQFSNYSSSWEEACSGPLLPTSWAGRNRSVKCAVTAHPSLALGRRAILYWGEFPGKDCGAKVCTSKPSLKALMLLPQDLQRCHVIGMNQRLHHNCHSNDWLHSDLLCFCFLLQQCYFPLEYCHIPAVWHAHKNIILAFSSC